MTTTNKTKTLIGAAAMATALALGATGASARGVEDCSLAWGQAVRSYLTQNRTKGPEDAAFRAACEIETGGDKAKARVEAVLIGVTTLVKLDPKGCARFLESYVGSREGQPTCTKAAQSPNDTDGLRKMIQDSIPAKHGK